MKRLLKKSAAYLFQEKIKAIIYIGELVKFHVAPWYLVFGALNYLFQNFSVLSNIELFTTLLETCGRFMLKCPISSERLISQVDAMMRMKVARNLPTRECLLIDNAYFSIYPPKGGFKEVILPPNESYARFLIYQKLDVDSADFVLEKLLKFDWQDQEVLKFMTYCFENVGWIKYSNLDCLAWVLAELHIYYPEFCINIIDGCCERIRSGLEHNAFKDNQNRISTLKFLGELFNYFLIPETLIFDTLFLLTQCGHRKTIYLMI